MHITIQKKHLRKIAIVWTILNLLSLFSIILITVLYGSAIHAYNTYPFAVILIGMGLVLNCIQWLFSHFSKDEIHIQHPGQTIILWIELLLYEISACCLGLIVVLNRDLVLPANISLLPIYISIFASSMLICRSIQKGTGTGFLQSLSSFFNSQSNRSSCLFKIIATMFVSVAISEQMIRFLNSWITIFPNNRMFLVFLHLIIPMMVFNLILLATAIYSKKDQSDLELGSSENKKQLPGITRSPTFLASIITLFFFGFIQLFFTIGYGTFDDPFFLSIVTGYMGGIPEPYLTHINSLLGEFFQFLFQINSQINWIVVLLYIACVITVWILTYLVCYNPGNIFHKSFKIGIILLFNLYFIVNITFTTSAAMISLAGCCLLILSWYKLPRKAPGILMVIGAACILLGSFIRPEAMLYITAFSFCILPFIYKSLAIKRALISTAITTCLVAGGYLLDQANIQRFPDWAEFTTYNLVRFSLHDTSRRGNMPSELEIVQWSDNDGEAFLNWFFPDQDVYSLSKLSLLSKNVSDIRKNTLQFLADHLTDPFAYPYILLNISCILFILKKSPSRKTIGLLGINLLAALVILFFFSWKMKLPFRVMFPLQASSAILSMFIQDWENAVSFTGDIPADRNKNFMQTLLHVSITCLFLLAFLLVNSQVIGASNAYRERQTAYRTLMNDLNQMETNGELAPNPLIIGPGLGMPLHWAAPFAVDLPQIQYLPMGWTTFAPSFLRVLDQFGIDSLSQAIYQNKNVYVMTRSEMVPIIIQYEYEHHGVDLQADILYTIEENDGDPEYAGVHLYRFVEK